MDLQLRDVDYEHVYLLTRYDVEMMYRENTKVKSGE